jgi:lactoylglutathione lyase
MGRTARDNRNRHSGENDVAIDDFPTHETGMVLTTLLIVEDQERSRDFYRDVLGATVLLERDPVILVFHNGWIILNVGGGATGDKPTVTMSPPSDPNTVSMCMNVRVADIWTVYEEWRTRGATFLTPPVDRGPEIRCYLRDPDGYLIEVGQSTRIRQGPSGAA